MEEGDDLLPLGDEVKAEKEDGKDKNDQNQKDELEQHDQKIDKLAIIGDRRSK